MKIGIVCAVEDELRPFLEQMLEKKETGSSMLTVYEGTLAGKDVALTFSGVCKVNAAIAAKTLIDSFGCRAIINAGTAGGMDPQVGLFDTVVATEVVYHDVAPTIITTYQPWMPSPAFPVDPALLALARKASEAKAYPVRFGRMATGEQFIEDDKRDEINEKFAPLSVDMETAAIAHVCYVSSVPFLAVRSITDTADHQGLGTFAENCVTAATQSADFVNAMLALLRE